MLQAMKEEPPLNAKCKDKFLIQSTLLTPEKEGQDIVRSYHVPFMPCVVLLCCADRAFL